MHYYIRQLPDEGALQVWKIDERVAVWLGVADPEHSPGAYFRAAPGENIWETLRRQTPWFDRGDNPFQETVLGPGQFYPRVARPQAGRLIVLRDQDNDYIVTARSQLLALTRQLGLICETIHPCEDTFDAFGHSIRNLLILACTEVETHWRGVLAANNFRREQYSTRHYVLLQRAMKLSDYAVRFPFFPWLAPVNPFKDWGKSGKPTQELRWYDAYNGVKHNREQEFKRATLRHVFEAITACLIMMDAQFSGRVFIDGELRSFFHISARPTWPLADYYIPAFKEFDVREVDYRFNAEP
jgi:hypothetical protein